MKAKTICCLKYPTYNHIKIVETARCTIVHNQTGKNDLINRSI